MTINTVTVSGKTFERKGKAMTHVVAFITADAGAKHVEWASTLDLARKNFDGHLKRWIKAKAGETLRYPWSTEAYRGYTDIVIFPVEHS